MPHLSAAIANSFLDIAKSKRISVDPMKLQKLVYFAHGWHLAFDQGPMSLENAHAWMYGPVFPNLYHALKSWGAGTIQGDAQVSESPSFQWNAPRVTADGFALRLIDRVWAVYSPMSGVALSQLTHKQGSPWYEARIKNPGTRGPEIPNDLIYEYFKKQLDANGNAAR